MEVFIKWIAIFSVHKSTHLKSVIYNNKEITKNCSGLHSGSIFRQFPAIY